MLLEPQLCFPAVGDVGDLGLEEELRLRERIKTDSGRMRMKMGRRVGRQAAMM